MEIELKLALEPAFVAHLKRHPLLAGIKSERRALHSIYFDTPEFALTDRKIALRLRRIGYHWVQTLKAAAPSVGALSSRPEWEAQVMGNTPDLAILAPEALALLAGIDLGRLAPVFITDVKRTTWQVVAGETTMEIALDQGEVRAASVANEVANAAANPATSPISEIELELKAGPPEGLFVAALSLLERVPLRLDSRSKAAIGYRLAGAVKMAPAKARWPKLDPAQAAGLAWTRLVEAALAQLVDNLPGFFEQPEDIEYLHQVRVALRRLMSLARLLAQFTQPEPIWLAPLREHMALLNPARDWDVFLQETLPRLDLPHDAAFQTGATALATAARQAAQSALASPAFTRVVLQLGQALLTPPATGKHASAWAAKALEQRWKDVRRRGVALSESDKAVDEVAARHRLRIAVKKLRYASDALANLYGKRGKATLAGLENVQESLGALNDLAVAERLMQALSQAHPESAFSAGRVVGKLGTEAKQHAGSRRLARELADIKPFWRKP
ncbi:MAG: CHAD domain-containing protein [Gallionellaceae bacterium]|nr:CHAD domain-containing protein [Gallionellaceae bacterium]